MNARSELIPSTNFSDGGVLETARRFHIASWASVFPPFRFTRGSGEGARVDLLLLLGEGELEPEDDVDWEQAARSVRPMASTDDLGVCDAMPGFLKGDRGGTLVP